MHPPTDDENEEEDEDLRGPRTIVDLATTSYHNWNDMKRPVSGGSPGQQTVDFNLLECIMASEDWYGKAGPVSAGY